MKPLHQKGFAMPVIILLVSLMAVTAYSVLSQAGTSVGQSYNNAYKNLSRVAADAGLGYAQEQFDNSICDSYNGTAEQNLAITSNYRTSFKVEVLESSSDGLSKTIKSTGYTYSPASSTSAKKTSIQKSIIYNAYKNKCKDPNYYSPLLWLDASDQDSLLKAGSRISQISASTKYGAVQDNTRDSIEERQDNGAQTNDSWQSQFVELHNCNPAEYSNTVCTAQSTKRQNIGLIFAGINVPKNSSILSANLTLNCSNRASSGPVTTRVHGFYKDGNNANPDLFNSNQSNQIKDALNNKDRHTASSAVVTTNKCSPDGQLQINVKDVIQEIINNNDWNPSQSNNSRLGLLLSYVDGNGSRQIYKDGNVLSISYSPAAAKASINEAVGIWLDKSGNSNDASAAYGSSPILEANQIGGKASLKFTSSILVANLIKKLDNQQQLTAFAVIKPDFSSSSSGGRIISGMNKSANDDETMGQAIIPLLRYGDKTGYSSQYAGSESTFRTNYECSSCQSTASVITSAFAKQPDNFISSSIFINQQKTASQNAIKPAGNPYSFSIDQFYIGGNRNGIQPSSGQNYLNGNFAEIIIYDKALNCRQIISIQNYLQQKWNIPGPDTQSNCTEQINKYNQP